MVVALAGARRPEEIEEIAAAADWVLTEAEREEIRAVVAEWIWVKTALC